MVDQTMKKFPLGQKQSKEWIDATADQPAKYRYEFWLADNASKQDIPYKITVEVDQSEVDANPEVLKNIQVKAFAQLAVQIIFNGYEAPESPVIPTPALRLVDAAGMPIGA